MVSTSHRLKKLIRGKHLEQCLVHSIAQKMLAFTIIYFFLVVRGGK